MKDDEKLVGYAPIQPLEIKKRPDDKEAEKEEKDTNKKIRDFVNGEKKEGR